MNKDKLKGFLYGADRVVHVTWPENFMEEQEQMSTVMAGLAKDDSIKALIVNQAVPGALPALDRLLETRSDMFIVLCRPQENIVDVSKKANLILDEDVLAMGPAMAEQA